MKIYNLELPLQAVPLQAVCHASQHRVPRDCQKRALVPHLQPCAPVSHAKGDVRDIATRVSDLRHRWISQVNHCKLPDDARLNHRPVGAGLYIWRLWAGEPAHAQLWTKAIPASSAQGLAPSLVSYPQLVSSALSQLSKFCTTSNL